MLLLELHLSRRCRARPASRAAHDNTTGRRPQGGLPTKRSAVYFPHTTNCPSAVRTTTCASLNGWAFPPPPPPRTPRSVNLPRGRNVPAQCTYVVVLQSQTQAMWQLAGMTGVGNHGSERPVTADYLHYIRGSICLLRAATRRRRIVPPVPLLPACPGSAARLRMPLCAAPQARRGTPP